MNLKSTFSVITYNIVTNLELVILEKYIYILQTSKHEFPDDKALMIMILYILLEIKVNEVKKKFDLK